MPIKAKRRDSTPVEYTIYFFSVSPLIGVAELWKDSILVLTFGDAAGLASYFQSIYTYAGGYMDTGNTAGAWIAIPSSQPPPMGYEWTIFPDPLQPITFSSIGTFTTLSCYRWTFAVVDAATYYPLTLTNNGGVNQFTPLATWNDPGLSAVMAVTFSQSFGPQCSIDTISVVGNNIDIVVNNVVAAAAPMIESTDFILTQQDTANTIVCP